jgi:hypothetical protein
MSGEIVRVRGFCLNTRARLRALALLMKDPEFATWIAIAGREILSAVQCFAAIGKGPVYELTQPKIKWISQK